MSKETLYPAGKALKSAIHEAKYQILVRLYLKHEEGVENQTGFKHFRDDLRLFKVEINRTQLVPLSLSAFERALNRAKREGWVYLHCQVEQEGINPVKTFRIGLTPKGKEAGKHEWEIICENN